jgi:hypothetical protein
LSLIVEPLPATTLREIVAALGIDCEDLRRKDKLVDAITRSDAGPVDVVELLSKADLSTLCEIYDVSRTGRKVELVERVLAAVGETADREIVPTDGVAPARRESDQGVGVSKEDADRLGRILNIMIANRIVKVGGYSTAYCASCGKTHPKQWFWRVDEEASSFYVCFIGGPELVFREGGGYKNVSLATFIEQNTHFLTGPVEIRKPGEIIEREGGRTNVFGGMGHLATMLVGRLWPQSRDARIKVAMGVVEVIEVVLVPPFTLLAKGAKLYLTGMQMYYDQRNE